MIIIYKKFKNFHYYKKKCEFLFLLYYQSSIKTLLKKIFHIIKRNIINLELKPYSKNYI